MDAKKAKEFVAKAKASGISDVERQIEQRAKAGYSDVNYYKTLNRFQVAKLKGKGFEVSGPYGGANGSHLWIQW